MAVMTSLCFVTAHPNPANHFVEYIQAYEKRGIHCKVVAGKDVSSKFAKLKCDVKDLSKLKSLTELEQEVASQSIVSKAQKSINDHCINQTNRTT